MAIFNVNSMCTDFSCLPIHKLSSPAERRIIYSAQTCSHSNKERLPSHLHMMLQPIVSFLVQWLKIQMLADNSKKYLTSITFTFFFFLVKRIGDIARQLGHEMRNSRLLMYFIKYNQFQTSSLIMVKKTLNYLHLFVLLSRSCYSKDTQLWLKCFTRINGEVLQHMPAIPLAQSQCWVAGFFKHLVQLQMF